MFKRYIGAFLLFIISGNYSAAASAQTQTLSSVILVNSNLSGDLVFHFNNGWQQRVAVHQRQALPSDQLRALSGQVVAVTITNEQQATYSCGSFTFNGEGIIKAALVGSPSLRRGLCLGYFR